MRTAIIVTLLAITVLATLGGIAHENSKRGFNAAIVAAFGIVALAVIVIIGG